jgi:hypothetical protein
MSDASASVATMDNNFGQDIQPGDYVGLGQRAGNGTEMRVGRVLSITVIPNSAVSYTSGRNPIGASEAKAHVLWEEELPGREEDGYTYQSKIDFYKLFKIDGDTLSSRIKRHLDIKYQQVTAP